MKRVKSLEQKLAKDYQEIYKLMASKGYMDWVTQEEYINYFKDKGMFDYARFGDALEDFVMEFVKPFQELSKTVVKALSKFDTTTKH